MSYILAVHRKSQIDLRHLQLSHKLNIFKNREFFLRTFKSQRQLIIISVLI